MMSQPAQGEKSVSMTWPWSLGLVRTRGHQSVCWVTWQTKGSVSWLASHTMEGPKPAWSGPASPSARDSHAFHPPRRASERRQAGKGDTKAGSQLGSATTAMPTSTQTPLLTDLHPFISPSKPTQVPPAVGRRARQLVPLSLVWHLVPGCD